MFVTQEILILMFISLLSICLLYYSTSKVINARKKYRINPPKISGNKNFERVLRAQTNTFEAIIMFMPLTWIVGLTINAYFSSLIALLWLFFRYNYIHGYIIESDLRLDHYIVNDILLKIMMILSFIGIMYQLLF